MLATYFSIIQNYVYSIIIKESTLFTTKTRFSNEVWQHYLQESFDSDSFVSKSRLDTYAITTHTGSHTVCTAT